MLSLEEESYDSDFDLPSLPKVKNRTRDQITMNDRFLDENVPEDRNTNQYTKRADPAVEAYKWLMRWRIRVQTTDVSHITDAFSCWVPSCDGGIDITSGNYRRMAVDGSKELCHRFVYRFWYPSYSTDNDVSHLCVETMAAVAQVTLQASHVLPTSPEMVVLDFCSSVVGGSRCASTSHSVLE